MFAQVYRNVIYRTNQNFPTEHSVVLFHVLFHYTTVSAVCTVICGRTLQCDVKKQYCDVLRKRIALNYFASNICRLVTFKMINLGSSVIISFLSS